MLTPPQKKQACRIYRIIIHTARKHNIPTRSLIYHNRRAGVAWARFEAMWRARQETGAAYELIGRIFGHRNHSTVMHGINRYENR